MYTHIPFAYDLGPLQLTGFGIAMLLAFVIGQMVASENLEARGHDAEIMGDVTIAAVVGGLLGAKLYYAVLVGDLGAVFSRAGFVFWGGLIGGIAATAGVILYKKASFAQISDAAAPGLAAAYSVGRSGCWAVGDDYGTPWNGPLSVAFPEGAPPSTVANLVQQFGAADYAQLPPDQVLAVHPTQLYETAMGLVMFFILWRMRNHARAAGWLFGAYCVLAGLERFIVEFFRAKDDRFFGMLTMAQVIAIGFVLLGTAWMAMRARTGPGRPGVRAA
ncbi:MAG: prolipoprotein diacylglyceryl transferase [Gemmatimonadaceae bacterium]|nr:prolipoprotein diacylglyceryl transferase [Gemmatimonadaceae bacterium]MCW5825833.1 prolipoprotein diacylglyceryl transferase [Gemmatimonadaceae bacterium]